MPAIRKNIYPKNALREIWPRVIPKLWRWKMASFKMKGADLYDNRGQKIASAKSDSIYDSRGKKVAKIQSDSIYDDRGQKVAKIQGDSIYDGRGQKIGTLLDVKKAIDGAMGRMAPTAFWLLFVR